jgi:general secretion pathway protein C
VRAVVFAIVLAACGPKVHMDPMPMDEDDPSAGALPTSEAPSEAGSRKPEAGSRIPAPPGAGTRTAAIGRAQLVAALDAGPGAFLRGFEVAPVMVGGKFGGWRLVRIFDGEHRFDGLDLAPGDVLIDVNGMPVSQPDQLSAVFDALRTANQITVDLERGGAPFRITVAVKP